MTIPLLKSRMQRAWLLAGFLGLSTTTAQADSVSPRGANPVQGKTGPVLLAPDGAWCWFGNPRALFKDGVLYFGYVRQADGRVALNAYDPRTRSNTVLWLSRMQECDDHNNPGLLELTDGRLLAVCAKHNTERFFHYRLSANSKAELPANWGSELTSADTSAALTYSNPYQLAGESGRIFNFMRNLNFNPTFTVSDSSATNWSPPKILIKTGTGRARPYVQYCSDYQRRIDFVYTDGHPLTSVTNSLYHAYYRNGTICQTDGAFLKSLADAPLLHDAGERGSLIYRFSAAPSSNPDEHMPGGRAWCWDIGYSAGTTPVTVFSVQRTNVMGTNWAGNRIYYYYARWTGNHWQKRFIAHAGRPLYEGEIDYAGGITLDPANPSVIYLSSNATRPFDLRDINDVPLGKHERYELYRGVTQDGGLTFKWTAITTNSAADNLRPYVPRKNPYPGCVLWFSGQYNSYTSWQTAVYGLFDVPAR